MLYRELAEVNELDSQISDMHSLLADLYAKRAALLAGTGQTAESSRPLRTSKLSQAFGLLGRLSKYSR